MSANVNELNYRVITSHGDVPIKNIKPGDLVYNYLSGELMEVRDVQQFMGKYSTFVYTDGRIIQYLDRDLVLNGTHIYDMSLMKHAVSDNKLFSLPIRSYEFNNFQGLLNPALIGALYVYGDWNKYNANLPITAAKGYNLYGDKYILKASKTKDLPDDSMIEFINPDLESLMLLTRLTHRKMKFNDFFYREYYTEILNKEKRTIPRRYMYSSIKERNQFMSGVLDIGKHFISSSGEIVIYLNNQTIVKELQKLLWSLGIISTSIYSPGQSRYLGYDYTITIKMVDDKIPDFVYGVKDVEGLVAESNKMGYEFSPKFKMVPNFVRESEDIMATYNLLFDNPNEPFLTSNFMPRVSI